MQISVTCGVWRFFENQEWKFVVDQEKWTRILRLESNTTLEEMKVMVIEDYEIQIGIVDVEFSYLPLELGVDSPPIVMTNQRQLNYLVGYMTRNSSMRLYVSFKPKFGDQRSEFNLDLNIQPLDSNTRDNDSKQNFELVNDLAIVDVGHNVGASLGECLVKPGQLFTSKEALQATLEVSAMKYNFDYRITKSDKRLWCIRCVEVVCKWSVRAECLGGGSTYFKINKYVPKHTCAPSRKHKIARTPSARTIGHLIMHRYEGVKEGPKPNDIVNIMRTDYGFELTYNQAWESREYAVNEVRGIPEKSYAKIPKYLHMLEDANPGTYTKYEIDLAGKFKYLFLSFGQSIRGFYKAIRKVIVVDGTFLKNKYKGVLLVATAVYGNSNLYPLAFGIVDSENDLSWEWFLMQLKVVIDDDEGLAFVSDRHSSIGKSIGQIYPLAKHGICIHHLLNNVITSKKGKGMASLIAKASKVYRVPQFEALFTKICSYSPTIGKYLTDANVEKWARCHFLGYRYDIRTTNPAESINAALKSPREYPIILLLDSIREMLTRWFFEHRALSTKHTDPLTAEVEKKIDRRIEKAKKLTAYQVDEHTFDVKGGDGAYVVDLEAKSCSCGKFNLVKIPCRHAIKAAFALNKDIHPYADEVWTTVAWRSLYEESIHPINVPEDEWTSPEDYKPVTILPPETRRGPGRRKKRRFETVEDKIRSSQGSRKSTNHKCSRCDHPGHNRTTCDIEI